MCLITLRVKEGPNAYDQIVFYMYIGGGGGKRRGLGPRNDVLTTCKAVTQRGGQWIITVLINFFPQ